MKNLIRNSIDLKFLQEEVKRVKDLSSKCLLLTQAFSSNSKEYKKLIELSYQLAEPDKDTNFKGIKKEINKINKSIY